MPVPEAPYFTPELLVFLRQLRRNNNREWFARNKARYEKVVRGPALNFISGFAPLLRQISPHFVADARPTRGSLFRIYRDTRFAADKRPFKTHVGIHFSHAAGRDAGAPAEATSTAVASAPHAPVFYLHLEPENCFAAAGIWHPDYRALTKVRAAIVRDPGQWGKLRRKLELEGDRLSNTPRGYDAKHPFIEDIKQKDFVCSVAFSDAQLCRAKFMRDFFSACRSMAPLVQFVTKALDLKF
jgi:uncharacterized protein (TIGR02453 family)